MFNKCVRWVRQQRRVSERLRALEEERPEPGGTEMQRFGARCLLGDPGVSGHANFIVSGDADPLAPAGPFRGIPIITPAAFVQGTMA